MRIVCGAIAIATTFVACGEPARPIVEHAGAPASPKTSAAAASASVHAAPNASTSSGASTPPPPATYEVRLEAEPAKNGSGFSLFARTTGLDDRVEVMRFAATKRCDAAIDSWAEKQTLEVGCGDGAHDVASWRGSGSLVVVDVAGVQRSVNVPSTSTVSFDTKITGQPVQACAEGVVGPVVEVFVAPEAGADEYSRTLRVRAPKIDLDLHIAFLPVTKCEGLVMETSHTLVERCAIDDTYVVYAISPHDGALHVDDSMRGYMGNREFPAGATVLPCGARMKFHPLSLRDAKYVPFAGVCRGACFDKENVCARPCYEKLTDAGGALTAEGTECVVKCGITREACELKCFGP
jgi:hypothetical protein